MAITLKKSPPGHRPPTNTNEIGTQPPNLFRPRDPAADEPDGPTVDGVELLTASALADDIDADELLDQALDLGRRDRALGQVTFGYPRTAFLREGPYSVMRLSDFDLVESASKIAEDRSGDAAAKRKLYLNLDEPLDLSGPSAHHDIDVAISALYAEFPQFADALNHIRQSAYLSISRGAAWLSFKPLLIVSPPGFGKTSFASKLASIFGLPMTLLDGSTMTTRTALLGGDAMFNRSRVSNIVECLATHGVANPIVVFDEIDKVSDTSRGASESPAEAVLAFLERHSARSIHDHSLGINLDLSHLNWLLLANDLNKVPAPVRDRCKVIEMQPLSTALMIQIAAREVGRRDLSPDILHVIRMACERGQIKGLRKLHKLLDAAQFAATRSRLH